MTRQQFLNLKFPHVPYCFFGLSRGLSSKFCETIHYKNKNICKQLNFYWSADGTVSIGLYDTNEQDNYKKNQIVLQDTLNFTQDDVTNYCNLYLK